MASFYQAETVADFLNQTDEHVFRELALGYARRGYTSQYSDQTLSWHHDLAALRQVLQACVAQSPEASSWGLLLEFSIPCKERRIDAVLLVGGTVVLLETKAGEPSAQACRQIEEYALLLHYFHQASASRRIVPLVVAAESTAAEPATAEICTAPAEPLSPQVTPPRLATDWISSVTSASWLNLPAILLSLQHPLTTQLSVQAWDHSPYFPVPGILEAAIALRSGLSIREIAHSEASEHEIDRVQDSIQRHIEQARRLGQHIVCFLTGVPGSGKTLVGLGLAHSTQNQDHPVHFMSGNGPLVHVLQHLFKTESMQGGATSLQAGIEARTLIENVHVFARYYVEDNPGAPSNHALIFDEAQRAWNRNQNYTKYKRDYSEPEMLLRIMERHSDWAAVIALVGGGQEINDGEAGLEEWGKALGSSSKNWVVYASPEVIAGGPSTAGRRLFEPGVSEKEICPDPSLHLRTSNRSLRADRLSCWVNHVLDGNADEAAALGITDKYPILLSRSLAETRRKLREQGMGHTRYGLVASSGAARLRADGLESSSAFHEAYPWEHWYLAPPSDVRSSFQCEVFASEFKIQGLELDWVGLCWGGDFTWDPTTGWQLRALRHGPTSRWLPIRNSERRAFKVNSYRVLLTRARQGMILFVPPGDPQDPTHAPGEFDATARFLLECGVQAL